VVLWLCVPVCLCLSGTVCPWSTQIYQGWIQSISVVLWSGRWRAGLSCKVVAERYSGSQPACAPACCSLRRGTVPPVVSVVLCSQSHRTLRGPVGTVVQYPQSPRAPSGPVPTVTQWVRWSQPGPGHQGSRGSGSAQPCPTGVRRVCGSGQGQDCSAGDQPAPVGAQSGPP
jgi:hypothetical protein